MYKPRDVQSSGEPSQEPKLLITGINVQEEESKKFTIKELMQLLTKEMIDQNVVDMKKQEIN